MFLRGLNVIRPNAWGLCSKLQFALPIAWLNARALRIATSIVGSSSCSAGIRCRTCVPDSASSRKMMR